MSLLQRAFKAVGLWRAAIFVFIFGLISASHSGALGQACNSNPNINYCSPSGQTCGEPTNGSTPSSGYPNGISGAWPQQSTVTVNINTTGLQSTQVAAIQQAFQNWSGIGGVQFSISTSTSDLPAGQVNSYNVRYGSNDPNAFTGDNSTAGAASSGDIDSQSGSLIDNITAINPARVSACLDCFTKLMAHEIAHTFGLSDNQIQNSVIQDLNVQEVGAPVMEIAAADWCAKMECAAAVTLVMTLHALVMTCVAAIQAIPAVEPPAMKVAIATMSATPPVLAMT